METLNGRGGSRHLIPGRVAGVRATRPGWLYVDFVARGRDRPVSGWIRQSDVYQER